MIVGGHGFDPWSRKYLYGEETDQREKEKYMERVELLENVMGR